MQNTLDILSPFAFSAFDYSRPTKRLVNMTLSQLDSYMFCVLLSAVVDVVVLKFDPFPFFSFV